MTHVRHFQQQRNVWSIATGNLLTLSEQQLVDDVTVDSGCNGTLANNGFAFAAKRRAYRQRADSDVGSGTATRLNHVTSLSR